jgi:hypothetical protein
MFKEMKFGRVDILWPKANFRVLRAESGSELCSSLLFGKEAKISPRRSKKPNADATGVSGVIDTPKTSDFALAISKRERNLIPVILGIYAH